ncbi:FAD-dependent monooxygenase [Amycolatopsis sp. NPDC005232]|uniref:FAD-dependent monooxygenase n=1 Tax=Amycolatopsis sp. NPDC005232 TaxID=3157027 RepID=UPI0033AE7AD1
MDHDVPVLIVGGSLIGMTSAVLLGQQGIPSLVVERHPGSAIHPRAALILQRSMEILREAGIEDVIQRRSAEQFDQEAAIMAVETLAGKEIAWYLPTLNEGVRDLSPCRRLFATQVAIEPVLAERARELGAETRFGTEVTSFTDHGDGVTAVLRDRATGTTSTVRARYLIAADGAHSGIRERLGIGLGGHGVLSKSVTIYFHAEMAALLRERSLGVIMVVNPTLQGFFRIEKPYRSGFLAVHGLGDPRHPDSDLWTGLTDERCVELVRAALGVPDIDVEIDDVMKWEATAQTADRFSSGNVFLVGDSAHSMPPYGGYGGNTGIHDAHNLAWKLKAALDGTAGPGLLDTYETERRPVARFTVEQAYARYVTRAAPFLAAGGMEPLVGDADIDLGYRYVPGQVHGNPRELAGSPGSRAPHHVLTRDGAPISTHDLFGRRFVAFAPAGADEWAAAATAAAAATGIALDVHRVGRADSFTDTTGGFCAAYGIGPTGLVLVRPDGVVAWRASDDTQVAAETVATALTSALGHAALPRAAEPAVHS